MTHRLARQATSLVLAVLMTAGTLAGVGALAAMEHRQVAAAALVAAQSAAAWKGVA